VNVALAHVLVFFVLVVQLLVGFLALNVDTIKMELLALARLVA